MHISHYFLLFCNYYIWRMAYVLLILATLIGLAGCAYFLRKNILVMRQEGDQQIPYRVDLTSAESVYNSPVYYIRQNDVIYVEPNNMAKRGSTVMGSSAYQPGFWFGMITSLASVGALIWALFK